MSTPREAHLKVGKVHQTQCKIKDSQRIALQDTVIPLLVYHKLKILQMTKLAVKQS